MIYFNPGCLLTLETGVRIQNMKPVKQQDEEELIGDNDSNSNDSQDGGYPPDRQLKG